MKYFSIEIEWNMSGRKMNGQDVETVIKALLNIENGFRDQQLVI